MKTENFCKNKTGDKKKSQKDVKNFLIAVLSSIV